MGGIPGVSGELKVLGEPMPFFWAKEPGVVPCRSVDGLSPRGGRVKERSAVADCGFDLVDERMGAPLSINFASNAGKENRRRARAGVIRFPMPVLPDQVLRVYSQRPFLRGTPSELTGKCRTTQRESQWPSSPRCASRRAFALNGTAARCGEKRGFSGEIGVGWAAAEGELR